MATKINTTTTSNTQKISDKELYVRIQKKAYEIYKKGGSSQGKDIDNWLRAEREVKKELGLVK